MVKVVYVITGLSTGGAEMMLLKLLERLDRQRFIPHVISLTTLGELAPSIAALGIGVDAMGLKSNIPNPCDFFRILRKLKYLQPDVVHTWMYHADLLGGIAARLAGVRAVSWCIRNSDLDRTKTKLSTRAVVKLCAALSKYIPAAIISCSERAGQIHVKSGYAPEKMHIIPNGFDMSRFKPRAEARDQLRNELRLGAATQFVGLIGRFDPQKNHEGFFEAAAIVHRYMPEVHFVLAGRAIDQSNEALMQLIEQHDLKGNTHLLGLRDDMPDLMAALDLLVSSSSYGEAFPNVLGEAMASGVPCVTTDVGDSAWIVAKTGWVIQPSDTAVMANTILEALKLDPDERHDMGIRARERVVEYFELGQIVRRYEDFYESLKLTATKEGRL